MHLAAWSVAHPLGSACYCGRLPSGEYRQTLVSKPNEGIRVPTKPLYYKTHGFSQSAFSYLFLKCVEELFVVFAIINPGSAVAPTSLASWTTPQNPIGVLVNTLMIPKTQLTLQGLALALLRKPLRLGSK